MNTIITRYKRNVEEALRFGLDYYGIDGITLTVSRNLSMLQRLSPDGVVLTAILAPSAVKGCYSIYSRYANLDLNEIFHEIEHIRQCEEGRMQINASSLSVTWEGKTYDNSTPYEQRPWEIEAFERQEKVAKAYRKKLGKYGDIITKILS